MQPDSSDVAAPGGARDPLGAAGPRWAELGLGALNGWLGDFLAERQSALGVAPGFYHAGRPLDLTAEALGRTWPRPTGVLCVLVHGLGCNEDLWRMRQPDPSWQGQTFGSLLERDLGLTPLYVRYNTGRPIDVNGRQLGELLTRLVERFPTPPHELVLIGHSMGGLVVRSACHHAHEAGAPWLPLVRRAIYLGSPHRGAPLEQAVHLLASGLDRAGITAAHVLRDVLRLRSGGIQDLRRGLDLPWTPGMRHHFVAGTLARTPGHPVGRLLGDGLVPLGSACAESGAAPCPEADVRVFPGLSHNELARHPDVYAQIALWCSDAAAASGASATGSGPAAGLVSAAAPSHGQAAALAASGTPEPPDAVQPAPASVQPAEGPLDDLTVARLWALKQLVHDGFDHMLDAVVGYPPAAAGRVYDVLEAIPLIALPAAAVRTAHEGLARLVHGSIRAVHGALARWTGSSATPLRRRS